MSFQIGSNVGDYQIIGVLGAGGMGKVYKVRNVISDRVEAMKILLPNLASEPELADRFIREIKVLASLSHPNIASLHTALRIENQLVMIMELVEGSTLDQKLRQGRVPLRDGINYACQVLEALGYAHAQGVIHRDIKPANMMLTAKGVVKLLDFGIAKPAGDRRLTRTGTTLGSLHYMSPEQVNGDPLDARSDLYSVGVSLYEMVTGTRPFQGDSDYAVLAAHLEKPPRPPIELISNLPPGLNEIILMALAKDPSQRFQTAEAFRAALESVEGHLRPLTLGSVPNQPGFEPATQLEAEAGVGPGRTARGESTAPPLQVSRGRSYRAVYMGLGAILAMMVIFLTAMEAPKLFKRETPRRPSPIPTGGSGQTVPARQPSDLKPVTPSSNPESVPNPATPSSVPKPTAPSTPITKESHQGRRTALRGEAKKPSASPTRMQQQPVEPVGKATSEPSGAKTLPGGALEELADKMVLLSARANAAKVSLDHLQRQQNSAGLSLRSDMVASWTRMDKFMDWANASLSAGNPDSAKKYMDLAEQEVETLERFLAGK